LTENTQPALLVGSVALWRLWQAQDGPRPVAMSGHSLGEFSALCCAGVFSLADAARLVRARGRFMQSAVPVGMGAMAAVLGLSDAEVLAVCAATSRDAAVVEAVNFNAPGQVVIAGHAAAVDDAIAALKAAGAKRAMLLPVSAPFHTSLMQPAGEELAAVLDTLTLHAPQIPVVHNVTAATESTPESIRDLLVRQIASPVRWTECVATLRTLGAEHFVECGAGKVLGGLLKRTDRGISTYATETPADFGAALGSLAP
jgi:[acyl-carrier-protein] S-malonyltransferase